MRIRYNFESMITKFYLFFFKFLSSDQFLEARNCQCFGEILL